MERRLVNLHQMVQSHCTVQVGGASYTINTDIAVDLLGGETDATRPTGNATGAQQNTSRSTNLAHILNQVW